MKETEVSVSRTTQEPPNHNVNPSYKQLNNAKSNNVVTNKSTQLTVQV